jgi:hypothetical protein
MSPYLAAFVSLVARAVSLQPINVNIHAHKLHVGCLLLVLLSGQVAFEQPLQPPFIKAGGVAAVLDVVINGWPEGSNFAEPQHKSGATRLAGCSSSCAAAACHGTSQDSEYTMWCIATHSDHHHHHVTH